MKEVLENCTLNSASLSTAHGIFQASTFGFPLRAISSSSVYIGRLRYGYANSLHVFE